MVTLQKLEIYRRLGGDIDGWARASSESDRLTMSDDDWFLIDELRQGLGIIASGQASADFTRSVELRLLAVTEDEQTRQELRELAK